VFFVWARQLMEEPSRPITLQHERWLSIEAYTKLYQLVMDPSAQYVISMGALGTERDELAQAVLALHQGEGRQGALVNKLCAAELANCGVCSEGEGFESSWVPLLLCRHGEQTG
jgi:hypothetical protein